MMMSQISENEFEELMSKNRHVSSNAITRAVSDASVGDFSSAIETLVTAISLIKQSKVSGESTSVASQLALLLSWSLFSI